MRRHPQSIRTIPIPVTRRSRSPIPITIRLPAMREAIILASALEIIMHLGRI
jgi:hypothetical protein